ncbi:MAG: DUF4340 domain-containing protein, partial [Nitrospinae bacterium]|nr:DUF4340 domain-containing protein [Nitrospinota bacterium]
MPRFKNTLILSVIFIILAIIVLIIENPFKESKKKGGSEDLLFTGINSDEVSRIEITKGTENTILEKRDGGWIISSLNDFHADKRYIDNMIKKIKDMKKENMASNNPEKRATFQVDKENGIEIKIYGNEGKTLAHFFVGKVSPDIGSTYIRKEGANDVVSVSGYLGSIFYKGDSKNWRKRNIFDFKDEDVVSILLTSPESNIVLRRGEMGEDKGYKWNIIEPESTPAKGDTVKGIISTLSSLNTVDFPELRDLKEYGLDNPKAKVTVTLEDNSVHTLFIGNEEKEKKERYVKYEKEDYIYTIYNHTYNNIFKGLDDLREEKKEETSMP